MSSACANDTHGHRPSAMRRTFIFVGSSVTYVCGGEKQVGAAQNLEYGDLL